MSDQLPRRRLVADLVPWIGLVFSLGLAAFGMVQWYNAIQSSQTIQAYKLSEIERHVSAQDGRMDSIERRQAEQQDRATRLETQLDNIRSSSSVPLQGRR